MVSEPFVMVLTELIASLTTSLVSRGFPVSTGGKEPAANARDLRDWGSVPGSLGLPDPLEEGMTTHSSVLVWTV